MSQPPIPYPTERPRSNGLGVAGFIVSLVGIFTIGLLCPIGLLLSFIALFRAPRGFAIAGFIIGLLGTTVLALWLAFFGFITLSCLNVGKPVISTMQAEQAAKQQILAYAASHAGALPNETDGNAIIAGDRDGWGPPAAVCSQWAASFCHSGTGRRWNLRNAG